jgi:hypothetical protein
MCEMLFQIILLCFTGRIGRYEEYQQSQQKTDTKTGKKVGKLIPLRGDTRTFLEFVEERQNKRRGKQAVPSLSGWVSRQHDGILPHDLKTNLYKFIRFLTYVDDNTEETIRKMRKNNGERIKCIRFIEKMIESALVHASVDKVPDVSWISHLIASDMEFIESPFGVVTPLSVPKGPYSIHGYGTNDQQRYQKHKDDF